MFRAPGQLPPLSLLLDELTTRCPQRIAAHLGITPQTLKRYLARDEAPRAVQLALFWESRWGQSTLDCEVFNRDKVQRGQIDALKREGHQLRAQISRLAQLVDRGDYGAANAPLWSPSGDAGCVRAPGGPLAIQRRGSDHGVVAAAAAGAGRRAARVLRDPAAQLGQLRQDQRGQDGATDQHQALA